MASDSEIKLAELSKDYQNLKERYFELVSELRTLKAESAKDIKEVTEGISDLYSQIDHVRIDAEREQKAVSAKLHELRDKIAELVAKHEKMDDQLKVSTWSKLMKELSDSKLIPITKFIIWFVVAFLVMKGLVPKDWIIF